MSESDKINDALNPLPISKETGDALVKPAAVSIGNASKDLLDGIFHLTLDPIRKFNIQREADLEVFRNELSQQMSQIPEEFKDDSKAGLVLKAIEDSKYQLNEKDIREMFTKLISATFDYRKNPTITPAYSSIIAKMSPEEAVLLKDIYHNTASSVPFSAIKIYADEDRSKGYGQIGNGYLLLDNYVTSNHSLYLSLLESANLIEFLEGTFLTADHFANKYKIIDELINNHFSKDYDIKLLENSKSLYQLTELGKSFCKIVF